MSMTTCGRASLLISRDADLDGCDCHRPIPAPLDQTGGRHFGEPSKRSSCSVRRSPINILRHPTLLVLSALFILSSGCDGQGNSALPRPAPPVTVTYRDSILGKGKVIQIKNGSSHHLYNVKVVGRNFSQNASASVKASDHLAPGDGVEVGWLEFESWTPIPGETIEIYCDDYFVPYVSVVPE